MDPTCYDSQVWSFTFFSFFENCLHLAHLVIGVFVSYNFSRAYELSHHQHNEQQAQIIIRYIFSCNALLFINSCASGSDQIFYFIHQVNPHIIQFLHLFPILHFCYSSCLYCLKYVTDKSMPKIHEPSSKLSFHSLKMAIAFCPFRKAIAGNC